MWSFSGGSYSCWSIPSNGENELWSTISGGEIGGNLDGDFGDDLDGDFGGNLDGEFVSKLDGDFGGDFGGELGGDLGDGPCCLVEDDWLVEFDGFGCMSGLYSLIILRVSLPKLASENRLFLISLHIVRTPYGL